MKLLLFTFFLLNISVYSQITFDDLRKDIDNATNNYEAGLWMGYRLGQANFYGKNEDVLGYITQIKNSYKEVMLMTLEERFDINVVLRHIDFCDSLFNSIILKE